MMYKDGFGEIRKQLSIQFLMILYALQRYNNLDAFIVLFTRPNFFTTVGYRPFREIWDTSFTFQSGFCVDSKNFGTSSSWPILMSIWKSSPGGGTIKVDLVDNNKKIGEKRFRVVEVEKRLSTWIEPRPTNSEARPCMEHLKKGNEIRKVSKDAIGYAICYGDSVCRANESWIQQAAPFQSGIRWSVEPENFEKTIVLVTIRSLIKKTVWNDNDEMSVPDTTHPEYENIKKDIIAYGLLSHSINKACSLSLMSQLDLPNEFFWMTKEEFLRISDLPQELHDNCRKSNERFAARWLKDNYDALNNDCKCLLWLSKELVKVTIKERLKVSEPELQLNRWDAGWVQLKKGLFDNKFISKVGKVKNQKRNLWVFHQEVHKKIKKRLQPYVYKLGVLEREELMT